MRIAFIYPSIGLGGQQTAIFEIGKQLSEMGHDVFWLYIHDDAFKNKAMQYFTLKKMAMPIFNESRFGVFRIINRLYYYYIGAFLVWLYCLSKKIKFVIVSNSVDSRVLRKVCMLSDIKQFRYIGGSLQQVEPYWLQSYQKMKIDQYVSGYFGWPAAFKELASVGVLEHKFINFPVAVNTDTFYPLPEPLNIDFKTKLGLPENSFVIGWVGRIAKNMQVWNTLLLAAELKRLGVNDFVLLIVGGGQDILFLREQIHDLALNEQTIVTDWVPYDTVNQYINIMDCIPLLEEDPHGGSIVREAMASGRVALSVDGPSHTQRDFMDKNSTILVGSENFIADAAEHVVKLIENRDLVKKKGAEARKYALSNMTFRNQAQIIVNACQKVSQ